MFLIFSGADLALIEERCKSLMPGSFIVLRLYIFGPSSCVCIVLLVGLQIFLENVVISFTVTDNRAL